MRVCHLPTSFTGSFLWNTRRGEKSAPARANHAHQRTSQWSRVEVRHPARDGMRRCPVLADWTSHVSVHEHPRNCSYLQNGRACPRRQSQSWDKTSSIKASKSPNTLRRRTPQGCIFLPDSASKLLLHGHENKVPSKHWEKAHAADLRLSCSATASLTPEFQLHII